MARKMINWQSEGNLRHTASIGDGILRLEVVPRDRASLNTTQLEVWVRGVIGRHGGVFKQDQVAAAKARAEQLAREIIAELATL